MSRPVGRAPRPHLARSRIYRAVVPAALLIVAAGTIAVLILAGGVLLGVLPYPGR